MKYVTNLIVVPLLMLCFGGETRAQAPTASTIVVQQPWARATPGGATTGAAYMTLMNNGASADRLLSATTPLADAIQFHKETEDNGVSRMREIHSVDLDPGAKVIFRPGEMHLMIVGLKQPLTEGKTFPLALQFEKAGSIELKVPIEPVGAMQHEDMSNMMQKPDDATKK